MDLMRDLADRNFHSVACNQRAYSPGARPADENDYHYTNDLATDVWAIADAVGLRDPFHLVGHDHGAVLGWVVAASETGAARLASYSALSVPHVDAFSKGLCCDEGEVDIDQQVASQYFTMFTLPDSASIHSYFWYLTLGVTSKTSYGESFGSSDEFQKALWWYNGAMDAGIMSMPPLMSSDDLWEYSYSAWFLRKMFGGEPDDGNAQPNPAGDVNVPALYVCGTEDPAILCNKPYALKSEQYCKAGYTYVEVECEHNVLDCKSDAATQTVKDAIIAHVTTSASKVTSSSEVSLE